jgi:F0F1-type ATP synthase membrane subunit b/b'
MAETKTTTTRSTSTTRRKAAATRRSTTAKKAATTRATREASANAQSAAQPARNRVQQVQDLAERAVLVQVGAALEARDAVVGTVGTIADTTTNRTHAERQLKKFERRGAGARTQLERELRKTRTRVQRELRQRRQRLERTVKRNVKSARRDVEKQGRELQKNLSANLDRVSAEAQNVFSSGTKSTAKLVSEATERVNSAA